MTAIPDYWQRQTAARPLFPALLWSRPENRAYAGKLLIIGGNAQGFAAAAQAYAAAGRAGVGTARVLLPDSLARTLGRSFEAGEFAPSTPSGSFGQRALAEMLGQAAWADGVLVDGDIGRNSETAITIEKFLDKYHGALTLSSDTPELLLANPAVMLQRPETTLVLSFDQLQRLLAASHFPHAATSTMGALRLSGLLHQFTLAHHANLMVGYDGQLYVAAEGQVSSTPHGLAEGWPTTVAAQAAVWWLQNPGKAFAALTTAPVAQ